MKSFSENFKYSPDANSSSGSGCEHEEHKGKGKEFRCPFHTKGERENTIMNIEFSENRESNIEKATKAFEDFFNKPDSSALRFRLPQSLLDKCHSLEELRKEAIPYQTDVITGELNYRFQPFLPYQYINLKSEDFAQLVFKERPKALLASKLVEHIEETGHKLPEKAPDISDWIQETLKQLPLEESQSPTISLGIPDSSNKIVPVLTITLGGLYIHPEVEGKDKDTFSFVTSPFYPKDFGRYSENIEIVITRMSDIRSLDVEAIDSIHAKSNKVLREYGVVVSPEIRGSIPHQGVWIPKYKDK